MCNGYVHFDFLSWVCFSSVNSFSALGGGRGTCGKAAYFSFLAFSSAAWSFRSRILSLGVIFCTSEKARSVCRWIFFCLETRKIPHTEPVPNMLRKITEIFYRSIITRLRGETHLETGQTTTNKVWVGNEPTRTAVNWQYFSNWIFV